MTADGGVRRNAESGYLVAGRYRLLRRIGVGGMGAVWLANDQLLSREVAVKQVLSTVGMSGPQAAEQRQRFLREGRIAARLTHPHTIAMYDVALDSGEPWLVMEYLPSRSLATVLGDQRTLPVHEVAQMGAQLADALAAAHAAGVVHRDVKPGNVLIADAGRAQGTVKITDFGISRAQGDVMLTQTGIITGTPAYLAPEVARGHEPTEASDVFALGSTLFTAVEGAPPFGLDDNAMALLHRVASGQVDQPQLASELTPALLWMLEPDPNRRPTMTQARDALARVAAGRGGDTRSVLAGRTAVLPVSRTETFTSSIESAEVPEERGRPAQSWLIWLLAGVALALIVAVAATAVALANTGSTSNAAPPPTAPMASATAVTTTQPATTTAPSTTPAPSTTTVPSATTVPSSTPAPSTTTAPSTAAVIAPLSSGASVAAVRNYYKLLPDNTAEAFTRLGPTLQAQGFGSYNGFWSGFTKIKLVSASAEDNGATVTITLQFSRDHGSEIVESHSLTIVADNAGKPLIDRDTLLSSREVG